MSERWSDDHCYRTTLHLLSFQSVIAIQNSFTVCIHSHDELSVHDVVEDGQGAGVPVAPSAPDANEVADEVKVSIGPG